MVTLRFLGEEEVKDAEEIDSAYEELVEPLEEVVIRDQESILSIRVINPFFDQIDIKLYLDQILFWEETGISKEEERGGEEVTTSGIKRLRVEFQTETAEMSYEGQIAIKPGSNHLLIQFWDKEYPPKLLLNERMINKSIGPLYKQVGELPREPKQFLTRGLIVRDADEVLGDRYDFIDEKVVPKFNLIEIWIDEEKVDPLKPALGDISGPIRHQATLTPGKHRVKITSPVLHAVIFEGDIIFNGVDLIELTVHTCKTYGDPCRITVGKDLEEIFSGSYKELEHTEKYESPSILRDTSESKGGL